MKRKFKLASILVALLLALSFGNTALAAGGNGGDEIRHRSSFQRVPLCGMGKHGDTMRDGIPIFFSSCGKENGHSWSKEKTLRDDLTSLCQII